MNEVQYAIDVEHDKSFSIPLKKEQLENFYRRKEYSNCCLVLSRIEKPSIVIGIVIKYFYPVYTEVPPKSYEIEHWNYHPMRKDMTKTHETKGTLEDLKKAISETFKSLDRLYETKEDSECV